MAALMIKKLIYKSSSAKLLFKNLDGTQIILQAFQKTGDDLILQRILSRILWMLSSQDMLKQTIICNGLGIMSRVAKLLVITDRKPKFSQLETIRFLLVDWMVKFDLQFLLVVYFVTTNRQVPT